MGRFDKLPKDWKLVDLGSVGSFINGDRGKNYPSQKDFCNTGIPFINAGHIQDGTIQLDSMNYISEERFNLLGSGKIQQNDIIYCLRGSLGKTAIVQRIDEGAIASSLVIIRPNDCLTTNYLYYFLTSPLGQAEIRKYDNGSSQPNLSAKSVKAYTLPLPPLEEQRRIAAILDKADAVRRKRRDAIRLTEELLRSMFLEMFGDPVTNPKGWKIDKLGNHLSFITSGSRGWSKYYSETGDRFIRSLDVRMNHISDSDSVFVKAPNNIEAKRTCISDNDVLLTITGSRIGRVAPIPKGIGTAYISQHVAILRPQSTILPKYLSFFLSLESGGQRQIAKMQYGQTKPGLNLSQISSFEILLPPVEQQTRFNDFWLRQELALEHQTCASKHENNLFSSFIQRAFKGDL